MAKDKALTEAAGEYYVAFRLAAEACAVGLTDHGTRAIDIVVANPDTEKSITIQSKTMRNALGRSATESWWKWRVGTSRRPAHEGFFYAFVNLKDDPSETPDVFIVPSGQLMSLLEEYEDKSGRVIDTTAARLLSKTRSIGLLCLISFVKQQGLQANQFDKIFSRGHYSITSSHRRSGSKQGSTSSPLYTKNSTS